MAMTENTFEGRTVESDESCCGQCGNRGACSKWTVDDDAGAGIAAEGLFERLKREIVADDINRLAT